MLYTFIIKLTETNNIYSYVNEFINPLDWKKKYICQGFHLASNEGTKSALKLKIRRKNQLNKSVHHIVYDERHN